MPLILGTNSIKDTGYDVANSLRFDDGSTDYLYRSLGSQSSLRIGTFSYWVKRSSAGIGIIYFNEVENDNNRGYIQFESDDTWRMVDNDSSGSHIVLKTNRVFRDFSSWYHICVRVDTTQSTSTDRVRLYVNGVQETSFSSTTYPSQNDDLKIFQGGQTNKNNLGAGYPASNYYDGYMAEFVYCDGQSLDPTSFGEFDSDSPTIWKPIDVSGLTFGNNGFHLDFEDSSALGNDVSGNNNDFTVNNLTAIDQSTDTCTNNFATLNPLDNAVSQAVFSQGNLKSTMNNSNSQGVGSTGTFWVSSGKWYVEAKLVDNASDTGTAFGVTGKVGASTTLLDRVGRSADAVVYTDGGEKAIANTFTSSYGSTYTNGDIIGIYIDLDNLKIYFAKNGTLQNSGTGLTLNAIANTENGFYTFSVGMNAGGGSPVYEINFGGTQSFSISSGNTDDNGYGNFEYSPNITGDGVAKKFYSMCSKNLAEYG